MSDPRRNDEDVKCIKPPDSMDKWMISLLSGLVFIIIASPAFADVGKAFLSAMGMRRHSMGNKLTLLIVQGIIFVLIVRLMMS